MPGCGVCMGHSPSWDGHSYDCSVSIRERMMVEADLDRHRANVAEVELARVRAELDSYTGMLLTVQRECAVEYRRAAVAEARIAELEDAVTRPCPEDQLMIAEVARNRDRIAVALAILNECDETKTAMVSIAAVRRALTES